MTITTWPFVHFRGFLFDFSNLAEQTKACGKAINRCDLSFWRRALTSIINQVVLCHILLMFEQKQKGVK
jgi:hypothetical protein